MPVPRTRGTYSSIGATLGCAALLLCATASAAAKPGVVLVDFTDNTGRNRGEKIRALIIEAVEEADLVRLVPYSKVKSLAAARRVRAIELVKPKVLGKWTQAAGGRAAVTGVIARVGAELRLSVRIYDLQGAEIWEKTVPLPGGELKGTTAQRYAAAIAAAVGVRAPPDKPAPPPEPEPEPAPNPEPAPAPEPEKPPPSPNDEPEGPITAIPEPTRKPTRERRAAEPVAEEPKKDAEDDLARPGWVELTADVTFTWRNYRFCPEVLDCELPTPPTAGMAAVKYSTDKPYGGFFLRADVFPLRFLDNFVRGVGLSFAFGRSLFLKTHYTQDSVDNVFESTQQRITAEIFYRFYFRIGGVGDGWAGVRGGYLNHAFFVDPNPKIVESARAGLYGALDLGIPLQRFVRVEARAAIVPLASPGTAEREKYGGGDPDTNRPTQGGGWTLEAGLTSDFGHPEWHVGLQFMFDYASFGDRYNNPIGTHPEFGRALETYTGLRLGLRGRL